MPTDRDTYEYHFKKGNKIVHTGITNDIDRKEAEHRREHGLSRGHIKQVGFRTTYDAAFSWLQEQKKNGKPVLQRSYVRLTRKSDFYFTGHTKIVNHCKTAFPVPLTLSRRNGFAYRLFGQGSGEGKACVISGLYS